MSQRIHIIGTGSPFGDDRLGWAAAEALRGSAVINAVPPGRMEISILDRPGAMLPMHWREADIVILLDAVRSGATPGTRHRFDGRDLAGAGRLCSSHGFGIVSAIGLAQALGNMPSQLLLRGVEADPSWSGFCLSAALADALPSFVRDIAEEAFELANCYPRVAVKVG